MVSALTGENKIPLTVHNNKESVVITRLTGAL